MTSITIIIIMFHTGGAMVASLLTGGSTPSPLRPPNSGLPNAVTAFEVGEMHYMTLYVYRLSTSNDTLRINNKFSIIQKCSQSRNKYD